VTRQAAVLLVLAVVAALLLALALIGALSDVGIGIVEIIGGLSMLVLCRPISAWITSNLQRWPASLTTMGRSLGPLVIALSGAVLALCGLYDLFVH
jgi:hypothetical protein